MTKQTTTKTIEEVSPASSTPIITYSNYTFYEDEFAPYLRNSFF